MTIGLKTKKLLKVKKCPKNAQKSQNFNLKIYNVLKFFKNTETFLNKGTKNKKKLYGRSKLKR